MLPGARAEEATSRDLIMNLADMYNRVINWPGRTAEIVALSVAMALLFVAGVILSTNKLRKSARSLGIVGVVVIMALLWVVHEQTVSVKRALHDGDDLPIP